MDKPADSAALWNMVLRVEAEMTFPTGEAVVSRRWGGAVWGDPGMHVAVELPSGDLANPLVLEGCHGDSGDASLSLQSFVPLEV